MIRGVVIGASAIALVATGATGIATAGIAAPERGTVSVDELSAEIVAAMRRDLGLTAEQVRQRAAQQAKAAQLDSALRGRLGQAFAGSWFDAGSGKLAVAVTDARSAAQATNSETQVRVVKHSMAKLDAIKGELDTLAGKAAGASAAARSTSGKPQAAVAGLISWAVDVTTNSVVVTVLKGQLRPAALDILAKYGDAVRVQYTANAPRVAANFMDGGDAINFSSCSAGFNLRNPSTGQGYLLTAGHCVAPGSTLFGQGGVAFGPVLESFFPTYDDSIARNDSAGFWIQGPWVDVNPSNGGVIIVSGFSDSLPGTTMCKSGITTLWTCGLITLKDVTVQYQGASGPVFGLTQHSACVEPGDSGGSNVAALSVWSPEGVTSGAQLVNVGGRNRCLSAIGLPNVSWYFPIADSLAYYGPRYGVTTW